MGKILTARKLNNELSKRLKSYNRLNMLESYALFMGKSQLVELALKGLLEQDWGYSEEKLEKFTLGQTIGLLREHKLRPDFLNLLEELLEYRNRFAHEFLANQAIIGSLLKGETFFSSTQELGKALYVADAVTIVYDFLRKGKLWMKKPKARKKQYGRRIAR